MKLTLSEKVQDRMIELGYNQKKVCELSGINKSKISKLVNSQSVTWTLEEIASLCKALNISSDYLLDLSDIKSSNLEIKDISEKTGLNEYLISLLTGTNKDSDDWTILNNKLYDPFEIECVRRSINSMFNEFSDSVNLGFEINEFFRFPILQGKGTIDFGNKEVDDTFPIDYSVIEKIFLDEISNRLFKAKYNSKEIISLFEHEIISTKKEITELTSIQDSIMNDPSSTFEDKFNIHSKVNSSKEKLNKIKDRCKAYINTQSSIIITNFINE